MGCVLQFTTALLHIPTLFKYILSIFFYYIFLILAYIP